MAVLHPTCSKCVAILTSVGDYSLINGYVFYQPCNNQSHNLLQWPQGKDAPVAKKKKKESLAAREHIYQGF